MVTSEIDICNIALDLLGEKANAVNIVNPETDIDNLCARHYNHVLGYLLRNYIWNFAKERKIINRDVLSTPEFDFSDAYLLPNDFIRLINFNEHKSLLGVNYDITGNHLLLNNEGAASIRLRYIKHVTDVKLFDDGFVRLFSLYLALNLAYKKTNKQTLIDRLGKQIEAAEAKIISIGGQEHPPERIQRSSNARARRAVMGGRSASKYYLFED